MALTKEDLLAIGELMDSKLAPMQADMADIQKRVLKIEVTQEHEVLRNIRLLAEGHSGVIDRLDRLEELPEQVEDIQNTVSVLKHVFKEHTHN